MGNYNRILLILDGYSSRKGAEWLVEAPMKGIEVIKLPTNTSFFLQPNDQYFNERFQTTVRNYHDILVCRMLILNTSLRTKLMLGGAGCKSISEECIERSYAESGPWPMDFLLVQEEVE